MVNAYHIIFTLGVQLRQATLYIGYDYLNIEGAEIHGLVAGVELWFLRLLLL